MSLTKTAPDVVLVESAGLDLEEIYSRHADYVWATLQRFGVRESDLDDVFQEVFVVVHQRLHTFDRTARMTTWLYAICMRVASTYRRSAYVRREVVASDGVEEAVTDETQAPDELLAAQQARARLAQILDGMELERRAVFVMFEIEGLSCPEIASLTGAPLGTVYGRLAAARKDFEKALIVYEARDRHRGKR